MTNKYLRAKTKGINSLEQNLGDVFATVISNNGRERELFGFEVPLMRILRGANNVVPSNSQKWVAIEGCPCVESQRDLAINRLIKILKLRTADQRGLVPLPLRHLAPDRVLV
jgi:hypothetical protein